MITASQQPPARDPQLTAAEEALTSIPAVVCVCLITQPSTTQAPAQTSQTLFQEP